MGGWGCDSLRLALSRYFESELRRACFWASCFACFAARFSLIDRLGFFALPDGVDFDAMAQHYGAPT